MSMELLRLGLQFFAGKTKEEEDEEIKLGEEGVTGASGVTGSTPPAYTMPQNTVAAPKAQDFDTWYKANGGMDEAGYYAKYDLDPDRDYQNTVNTLNYDYQTSMATYGEQAEKMYQMGLQNSGVSDIFQANAFSSYLGNMNQAAANRITARKRNKAAFNDYVANMRAQHGQYETGIKTEYDTKLNSALTYAMSKYNGYNLQDVLNQLGVSGYYTDIVDEVGKRLSGMDATSLQAATETVLAQDIINNISGFTGSDNDLAAAKSMYSGMYGEDVIGKAFDRAKTIYQNSEEGREQMVSDLVTSGKDRFAPNYSYEVNNEDGTKTTIGGGEASMNAFIKNVWEIETDPNAEKFDQAAYDRAVKAWENIKADYDANIEAATRRAEELYTGEQRMNGENYVDEVIQTLIDEGFSAAVARDAANTLLDDDARVYAKRRATEAYQIAISGLGIETIDFKTYPTAEAFKEAIEGQLAGKGFKGWTINSAKYMAAKAWKEAYDAKILKGVEFIANNIETMGESIIDDYLKSSPNNFTEDIITAAWEKYNGTPVGEDFTESQNQTTVNELVTKWTDSFDPTMSKEEFVNNMITKDGKTDDSQRANAEAAWDQMESNYKTRMGEIDTLIYGLFRDDDGTSTWSDTPDQNAALNDFFTTQGLSEKEQQYVRDKLNTRKVNQETAVNQTVAGNLADIKQKNGLLTYADYMNASSAAEGVEKTNYQNSAVGIVKDVMNGTIDLSDADEYLTGFISSEGWDDLSDDEKRKKIVDAAMKDQNMTMKDKNEIVSKYIETKTSEIIDTDKGNAKASGLADAGDLVTYIKGLGLGSATEKELIKNIAEQMKFKINKIRDGQINWYGAVEGAEATFRGIREKGNKVTDSNILTKLGDVTGSTIKTFKTVNGVIYEVVPETDYTEAYWVELKPENLEIVGDGHTNTDDQRKGTYDLLVVLLEMQQDSGYVQGELPSSTTVKPSGGAGEIKIKDDHKYFQSETANPEGNAFQVKK